tara:strand:+ start:8524 stop:8679 length:156 start_codon:yes stop_codon:yes gene_type:complete
MSAILLLVGVSTVLPVEIRRTFLVMRHLQQPYSPIFMASQLQHGDKIGKNL